LAWGVFVAGVVQMLFQLPFMARLHLLPRPTLDVHDAGVKKILWLMVPALFGVSVSQINLLLDTVLASFLPTGSVSWLYYSDRLVELPLGVFAIAVSTVILPSLSRRYALADNAYFSRTLDWAVRMVLVISLPAALALFVLAESILVTLFYYGALTANDVAMASVSLRAYTLGLVPFMLIKVLAPGFFARQDTRTPVRIGIVAMVANMVMNIALVVPLHLYFKLGHAGLALATVLSAALNAGLLWHGLASERVFVLQRGFFAAVARYLLAAGLMAALLFYWQPAPEWWLVRDWWERIAQLMLMVAGGLVVYIIVLLLLGIRIRDFRAAS
ncbi:MAG TPA: murein biosynthesis integral membrane protein MurJ, partial [Pseudomonadales bacterium]